MDTIEQILQKRLKSLQEDDFMAERSDNFYHTSGRKEENRRAQRIVRKAIEMLQKESHNE